MRSGAPACRSRRPWSPEQASSRNAGLCVIGSNKALDVCGADSQDGCHGHGSAAFAEPGFQPKRRDVEGWWAVQARPANRFPVAVSRLNDFTIHILVSLLRLRALHRLPRLWRRLVEHQGDRRRPQRGHRGSPLWSGRSPRKRRKKRDGRVLGYDWHGRRHLPSRWQRRHRP